MTRITVGLIIALSLVILAAPLAAAAKRPAHVPRSAFLGYNFPPSPAEPRPFLEAFRQWKRPWLCRTAKCCAWYSNANDGHLL
jgi:hypothetical protein